MRAVMVTALGGPEVLEMVEQPDPVPGPGQVLVRVRAVCVHPADIAARVGQIPGGPVPPPFIPGWDIAGEVVAVGGKVSGLAVGEDVGGLAVGQGVGGLAVGGKMSPSVGGGKMSQPSVGGGKMSQPSVGGGKMSQPSVGGGEVAGPSVGGDVGRPVVGGDVGGPSVGGGVGGLSVGDWVAGMIPWHLTRGSRGGYAELVVADAEWLVPMPVGLDPIVAATVPLNALTARRALELMALSGPTTLLVTGASGGVGGFAAQLAVGAGHTVYASATDDDEEWVRGLGAHTVIPRSADLATMPQMPNVLDAVPVGEPAADAVADGGVLVSTRPTPPVDPGRRVRQEVVFVRGNRAALHRLLEAVAKNELRTRVAATFPLAEAAEAHRHFETAHPRGKLVLLP